MSRSRYDRVLKWTLLVAGAIMLLVLLNIFQRPGRQNWTVTGGPRVGVIDIRGPIIDSQRIVERIDQFARRRDIDAILVRINSPGGTVGASQEIYAKLRKVRDEGDKPVVASMGTVAASGGVYVALGTDTIMAGPGTATGSIGVILDFPVAAGLLQKLGIEMEVIKSGPLKDAGSPYRPATAADRASFQRIIDDLYEQFINVVAEERGLSLEAVREMATGEVFTGREALELGLIDLLGTYEDAVNLAGAMTGSDKRPVVVRPVERRRRTLLDWIIGDLVSESIYPQLMPQYRMW